MIPKSVQDYHGNEYWLGGVKGVMRYELLSLLGRLLYKPNHIKFSKKKFLNIGSGLTRFDDFINLDFFRIRNRPDVMHDLRYPLPFPNNRFDGIFSEHCLEHLSPIVVSKLLEECLRTLKPGGAIRISLPCLKKAISFYNNPTSHPLRANFTYGAEALRDLTQNWGHVSTYDFEYLKYLVLSAGFVDAVEPHFGLSKVHGLAKESDIRRESSFYLEAFKPKI